MRLCVHLVCLAGKAAIVMFEAIQQQYSQYPQQGRVQLICTGALTNAALLLLLYPEVKCMIDITIMGGALGVSSTTRRLPWHKQRTQENLNCGVRVLAEVARQDTFALLWYCATAGSMGRGKERQWSMWKDAKEVCAQLGAAASLLQDCSVRCALHHCPGCCIRLATLALFRSSTSKWTLRQQGSCSNQVRNMPTGALCGNRRHALQHTGCLHTHFARMHLVQSCPLRRPGC